MAGVTEIRDLELEVLRNFYDHWKNFHQISNTVGTSNGEQRKAIQQLLIASHAVDLAQKSSIITLDS